MTVCGCGVFFSGLDLLSEVYPGTAGIIKQPTIYSVAVSSCFLSAMDMRNRTAGALGMRQWKDSPFSLGPYIIKGIGNKETCK